MKEIILIVACVLAPFSSALMAATPQTPAQLALQFFKGSVDGRTSSIKAFAAGCSSRDRSRFQFRRYRNLRLSYEKLLQDSNSAIRLAGIDLGSCFQRETTLKAVGALVGDSDTHVSLAAMTQLAHSENREGVAPLSTWLLQYEKKCLGERSNDTKRCIFAVYAIGQCAQYESLGSPLRVKAAKAATVFLKGEVPKIREVSAVALSFVGTKADRGGLNALVLAERTGKFKEVNSSEVIAVISQIAKKLK